MIKMTLRKQLILCHTFRGVQCVKSVRIRSFHVPHFPAFGRIRTRKTPNTDTSHAVIVRTLPNIYDEDIVQK